MGSPGSAGAAAADAAATANSATSESSLIEGLTSPLAAVTAPTGQTAAGSTSLKPIDLGGSDPLNLPQSAAVVVLSLAGLGLFGLSLVRYRNRQTQNPSKNEKPMQIISTLPLSPKRQLIMVRIRDQEIVLSSTEQGISMLTEVGGGTARNQSYPMLGETRRERDTTASRSHEIIQDTRETMARLMPARETEERIITEGKSGKSEMLLKALNGIKEKKSTRKTPAEEPTVAESKPAEPTKGAKAAFPKYLANAFQQEAKRELAKQRETPAGTEEDSVENVSRMIREKLKTMQPTGN
jgi:flagellar biogenesis protein FliO